MPRASTSPRSLLSSTVKENRPAWCSGHSPGRPNSMIRTGRGKPLGEIRTLNRGVAPDGPAKSEKMQIGKKTMVVHDRTSSFTGRVKVETPLRGAEPKSSALTAAASNVVTTVSSNVQPTAASIVQAPLLLAVTSNLKISRAPITDETPPRIRPLKKPAVAMVTPTAKLRKPAAAGVSPKCTTSTRAKEKSTPLGKVRERTTPGRAREKTTPGRAREKITPGRARERTTPVRVREPAQSTEETPTRRVRSQPSLENQQIGSKEKAFSSSLRGKKTNLTPGRAPIKHLFLSPQLAKKNVKKEPLRKSVESHGTWGGSATRKIIAVTRDPDCEMPPAQPTNSPEIPRRGSREASGEGIRGYFGAGPMVAPEGMGFVRDRRKCKPRGTLVVGEAGNSTESDSSGLVESSTQMPLPSVASVEWMNNNNDMIGSLSNRLSGSSKRASSSSLSESKSREIQGRDGSRKERSSLELSSDAFFQQLRKSRSNGEAYYQHARRSQAYLQHLRTSQLSREGSLTQSRRSGAGFLRQSAHRDENELPDLDCEDITIDWRQGLPSESVEMTVDRDGQEMGARGDFVSSSISFNSAWAPPPEDRKLSIGNVSNWCASGSPVWYGFSPITPEFQRASQLPDSGSKAIDALVAGSVRRRIISERNGSAEKPNMLSSLSNSDRTMTADGSESSLSAHSSQDTTTSFRFAARKSYSSTSPIDMDLEPIPADTYICLTASPIDERLFTQDMLSQNPLVIDEGCSGEDGGFDDGEDETFDSEDGVEYASPIIGGFFSSDNGCSPRAGSDIGVVHRTQSDEADVCPKAVRRSSFSRTLEELMRHNFTL